MASRPCSFSSFNKGEGYQKTAAGPARRRGAGWMDGRESVAGGLVKRAAPCAGLTGGAGGTCAQQRKADGE
ncbi:MAG: hypothetical protein FJY56_06400 [Betaproteobacteria bacterium]|nr:hypothetical protein [Betaproteobacteria bacterium]